MVRLAIAKLIERRTALLVNNPLEFLKVLRKHSNWEFLKMALGGSRLHHLETLANLENIVKRRHQQYQQLKSEKIVWVQRMWRHKFYQPPLSVNHLGGLGYQKAKISFESVC